MEEKFLIKYFLASLLKARVKYFMKPRKDLKTSLGSVLIMECLNMNLCKYSMMG